jgi:hypothetical protein
MGVLAVLASQATDAATQMALSVPNARARGSGYPLSYTFCAPCAPQTVYVNLTSHAHVLKRCDCARTRVLHAALHV